MKLTRLQVAHLLLVALMLVFTYFAGALLAIGDYGLATIPGVAAWSIWAYLHITLSRKPQR